MNILLKCLIIFCIVSGGEIAFADNNDLLSCSPVKVKIKARMYILNNSYKAKKSKLFLITNKSDNVILLNHPQGRDAHANAGWASNLQPGRWSALVLAQPNFAISCAIVQAGKTHNLDCEKVIKVCEAKIKLNANESSSYWMSEDKSWNDMTKDVLIRLNK